MTEKAPEVSILIPVKDGMPYIEAALRTTLAQTFTNIEVIVIDDASSDDTPKLLAKMAAEDPRLRVLTLEKNLRPAGACNRGLEIARGAFVARMDADDLVAPEWIETELAYLKAHPELDIVGASRLFMRADETVIKISPKSEDIFQVAWISLFRWPFVNSTILFRRTARADQEEPKFDPNFHYAEDYDLAGRILEAGAGVNLPRVLLSYRVHDTNMSQTAWVKQQNEAGKVGERMQRAKLPSDVYDALEEFRDAYYYLEPRPAGRILKGFRKAIAHGAKEAPHHYGWMCREAAVLYLLAMQRTGQSVLMTALKGVVLAPYIMMRAGFQEIKSRRRGWH